MQVKVVGFEKVDYFSKAKQKQVQGISLYVVRKPTKDSIVGEVATDIWLPLALVNGMGFVPEPGSDVELIYDFDGRYSSLVGYKLIRPEGEPESEPGKAFYAAISNSGEGG